MKFLTYFVFSLMVCTILPVSAMAEEGVEDPADPVAQGEQVEVSAENTEQDIIVNVNLPSSVTDPVTEDPAVGDPEEIIAEDPAIASTYSVAALDETSSDPVLDPEMQTMKDVVVMVLGDYSPRTQTVTQYLSDGSSETYTEIVPGVAGMDWEWISGAGLFGLVLFSFLKLVGVLLKNG